MFPKFILDFIIFGYKLDTDWPERAIFSRLRFKSDFRQKCPHFVVYYFCHVTEALSSSIQFVSTCVYIGFVSSEGLIKSKRFTLNETLPLCVGERLRITVLRSTRSPRLEIGKSSPLFGVQRPFLRLLFKHSRGGEILGLLVCFLA